jgi:histidinol-phosphate aminotransferase
MSGNFLALAQPGVQQLSPYVPGKPVDELARELDRSGKASSSWRATKTRWAPVLKRWQRSVKRWTELTRYPDGNGFALKSLLAEQCRVEPTRSPWAMAPTTSLNWSRVPIWRRA